jgi:hypothetical protein
MEQVAYAIVGDGKEGFKYFGETFADTLDTGYWIDNGYRAIPVYVNMTDELKEFYFY